MATAEIEVGINGAAFSKGLDELRAKAGAFNKALDGSKDGFFSLEGERRVERNLGSMVSGLANATSGAEALAVALDRVENVFKSSLGASVAVAAITTLIGKYLQAQTVIESTNQAIANAGQFVARGGLADPNGDIAAQIDAMKKKSEELRGFWARIFTDNGEREQTQMQIRGVIDSLDDLKKKREELAQQAARGEEAKADEEYLRKVKEYNESIIEWEAKQEAARAAIRKKREASEAESAKSIASFHIDALKDYWRMVDKMATEERAKIDAKEKAAADAKKKREEEHAKEVAKIREDLLKREADLQSATAERNKEYRAQIIAEELKTPGQRNVERQAAAADSRAELRAINRIAQRAQDRQNANWRNPRMTNAERDALADKLKQQRAEDKKPQMEKDISEINASIKTLKNKIGIV